MIFVSDQIPRYCPACGEQTCFRSPESRQDFFAGASCSCDCGAHFQYVPTDAIVEATVKHGDLAYYVKEMA